MEGTTSVLSRAVACSGVFGNPSKTHPVGNPYQSGASFYKIFVKFFENIYLNNIKVQDIPSDC